VRHTHEQQAVDAASPYRAHVVEGREPHQDSPRPAHDPASKQRGAQRGENMRHDPGAHEHQGQIRGPGEDGCLGRQVVR
jgi:hypothetical protein